MRLLFGRLQRAPWRVRVPIKLALFAGVCLAVIYPNPALLVRHFRHLRNLQHMPDPQTAVLLGVVQEFDRFLESQRPFCESSDSDAFLIRSVEAFVCGRILYAWDWDVWGVVDYLPTVSEVLEKGREDCDGRAVLAASILQAKGIDAQLVADPRHMWVRTPCGDTMHPMEQPTFVCDGNRTKVQWAGLLDLGPVAFGVSVFPPFREAILLSTAWLLLLPAGVSVRKAAISVVLLALGLLMMRLAGRDPVAPHTLGMYGALLHLAVGSAILWWPGRKRYTAGRPGPVFASESAVQLERVGLDSELECVPTGSDLEYVSAAGGPNGGHRQLQEVSCGSETTYTS